MHVHVVAASGTGMGSLAGLLRELGHRVTGSDVRFDPPIGPALAEWGVECQTGFDPAHLDPPPDLVVVGNVCRPDNPEARAAIEGGLAVTHIAGALARFALEGTRPLVVAGTHGKTTTTSLSAWLLDQAGLEPGFLVGGVPRNFGKSFRAARPRRSLPQAAEAELTPVSQERRPPFVIEGDEYDTAFFEKTAKFLHYRAEIAILTSIEHDHIDIYPTPEAYFQAFEQFIAGLPAEGLLVANAADPEVVRLASRHARCPVAWYALEGQDTHGVAPHWLGALATAGADGTSFDLFAGGVAVGRIASPLPGLHNLANTVAALGAAAQGYGARFERLIPALAAFQGIKRRQELLGSPGGHPVYDDFAHHPTAVRETLAALRNKHPKVPLIAVFEPRSATACRALHQDAYATSFGDASRVILAPLGRDLPPAEALDTVRLADELTRRGTPAHAAQSLPEVLELVERHATDGSVIALLSNGAFGGLHGQVLEALGEVR
ncbi:MAG: UDP-N-acetylmuramate:L-alanyl-gamma-D-glutamyl-meso-diaminopimelate ligase [Polyangiaceae bacterium]|nr:UDP-N-acetylmuramate:L-alanyl-gamma-D-glutamyl-meso-diaminopimelate ligase [Polyangiaceae bacterium]MCW5792369.1 UDP-N-acetylmuramate:L-alanyl-gamma-D-glutamyl-meso-diaminopimelate ligase [Polyangiaceae bacterium]